MNILNEILINQRKVVVEFGCGISTLYMARVLSETGGRLISVENNTEWAVLVRQMLEREGLGEIVTLVDAPLADCSLSINGLQWYDEAAVERALEGVVVDLVLVDGPPAYEAGKGLARYPAFLAVARNLGERCAVILDDIGRPGEQEVLDRWRALPGFNLDVDVVPIPNFASCRRGSRFNSSF